MINLHTRSSICDEVMQMPRDDNRITLYVKQTRPLVFNETPDNCVWYRHHDGVKMQLVPEEIFFKTIYSSISGRSKGSKR